MNNIMQAKKISKDIYDVDGLLDERFGKIGTPERAEAEEKAFAFYSGAVIEEARKKAKLTKAELARRIGADRSYITKIENGQIEPKVSTFYRIAAALGFSVGLTPKMEL
jgi:DNA-binding XRE family transcriptional regulator